MASSTSWFCASNKYTRQWYAHTAGFLPLWWRLSAGFALAGAWLARGAGWGAMLTPFLVAPLAAGLYALSYILLRASGAMIDLRRLKAIDTALLGASTGLAVLLLGARLPLILPGAGLWLLAWLHNWWYRSSATASQCDGPVPPAFVPPVRGPVVSGYRSYDISHTGVDLGVDEGTPVVAPAPGRVLHAGPLDQWGHAVLLDHGGGWSTLLAHLDRPLVRRGATVAAGEPVGLSGTSGISTGPHLHAELRFYGTPVDPEPLLKMQ